MIDLCFTSAVELARLIRRHLQKVITARGLKQAEVAKLLGVAQPRVSDVMRGRIDLFSIDTLIDVLARLGIRAKLVLHPRRRLASPSMLYHSAATVITF
ncbi:MAG: helix-turn-helix transcriptional regulator [Candidatus Rokuibacteriota bacterium]